MYDQTFGQHLFPTANAVYTSPTESGEREMPYLIHGGETNFQSLRIVSQSFCPSVVSSVKLGDLDRARRPGGWGTMSGFVRRLW